VVHAGEPLGHCNTETVKSTRVEPFAALQADQLIALVGNGVYPFRYF
jgi:hypothetical protein